ncbi:nucleoside deaminase [Hymenobacter sp. ASUV-10]|uniref:tRNA-specific adenosine deaminase n=1 Tax=Hymenobacter aranciens TaxID=3063996 RepID=A0ABT9BKF1_9BACT|nr:nucleoside deaminase [Hymenobacter sp. ASUV-10]MDO7877018.1 nucleoside deaminase [Hymenobacter sp. ASUV-10]
MTTDFSDTYFMRQALLEAQQALAEEEIPIGAVVVLDNKIIGRGHNQTERLRDVTAHAEMLALTAAANHVGNKYLAGATLYVTVEPCVMCAGASYWAQVARVVFGAEELKVGFRRFGHLLHPRTKLLGGVLADECVALMRDFFALKRK